MELHVQQLRRASVGYAQLSIITSFDCIYQKMLWILAILALKTRRLKGVKITRKITLTKKSLFALPAAD